MNMKSAAAFVVGLLMGAAATAVIGAYDLHAWLRPEPTPGVPAAWATKSDDIQFLHRQQARLAAEDGRLLETVAELKGALESDEAWTANAEISGEIQPAPHLEEEAHGNGQVVPQAPLAAGYGGGQAFSLYSPVIGRTPQVCRIWIPTARRRMVWRLRAACIRSVPRRWPAVVRRRALTARQYNQQRLPTTYRSEICKR